MRTLILIALSLSFTTLFAKNNGKPDPAVSGSRQEKAAIIQGDLKVLSWNIYLLPGFLGGQRKRSKKIAEVLLNSAYDVIVFQEAFIKRHRKRIGNFLADKFPYQAGPVNEKGFGYNSGLWMLSKLELEEIASVRFSDCAGFDCMSKKGALLVEGEKEGFTFQLIGTHLQAMHSKKAIQIRHLQYHEIDSVLLRPYCRDNVPQIIVGDFNTQITDSLNFEIMLSTLQADKSHLTTEIPYTYDGLHNQLIRSEEYRAHYDYAFITGNHLAVRDLKTKVKVFKKRWKRKKEDLSDHYAVEASIFW